MWTTGRSRTEFIPFAETSVTADGRTELIPFYAPTMQDSIDRFLQYLRVERNASDLTIKSYREDLAHLVAYLTETGGDCPGPGAITTLDLRGYVASLHEADYAKTTIARRLASIRSFFR